MNDRKMKLIAYLKTGPTALHSGGWRHPEARLDDLLNPSRYEDVARTLEAAKFDGAFFADYFGIPGIPEAGGNSPDLFLRVGGQHSYLDPLLVLPIMARVTSRLGLGVTMSTSFFSPYQLARSLATVDVLSKGRVAWNVVTSTSEQEALNAGLDGLPPHDERYDRAEESLEACMALWKSWDQDSFVMDKEKGLFVDPSKIRYANYAGKWTKTRGPIATPPSPQGHPVVMQAGSSPRGKEFAARWAELIFTPQGGIPSLRTFYNEMQDLFAKHGREPRAAKILPGITVIVGETDAIAKERADYLETLQAPEYDVAYASLNVGADLTKHKTLEAISAAAGSQGAHGMRDVLKDAAQTTGSLAEAASVRRTTRAIIGSPKTVADHMQEIFEAGVADGFIVMPSVFPTSHEQFCRAVVPELQRRGLFRTEYSAATLRDNLAD